MPTRVRTLRVQNPILAQAFHEISQLEVELTGFRCEATVRGQITFNQA